MAVRLAPIRVGQGWYIEPIPWPLPAKTHEVRSQPSTSARWSGRYDLVSCTCRCRNFELDREVIFDALRSGQRKLVLPKHADDQEHE